MTTPGDPVTTLTEAMKRYTDAHDAMKDAAEQIAANRPAPGATPSTMGGVVGNAVPSQQ